MADEKESGAKDTALKVGLELLKQGYEDGPREIVREASKLLVRPLKLLNQCFSNLDLVLLDNEGRQRLLAERMEEKWRRIPDDHLLPPAPNVAGPLLMNYVFVQSDTDAPLRELFEQLLASAMDGRVQPVVHPSFVEILRQMTAAEARVVRAMALRPHREIAIIKIYEREQASRGRIERKRYHAFPEDILDWPAFALIENLARLGVVEMEFDAEIGADEIDQEPYTRIETRALSEHKAGKDNELFAVRGILGFTEFGMRFAKCCVA